MATPELVKVFSADRSIRKVCVYNHSFEEFIQKVQDKFRIPREDIQLVTEEDGMEIESGEELTLFLKQSSKLMILREGEEWQSASSEDKEEKEPSMDTSSTDLDSANDIEASQHQDDVHVTGSRSVTPVTAAKPHHPHQGPVFTNRNTLMSFLRQHPKTMKVDGLFHLACNRSKIVDVVACKMQEVFGNYPNTEQKLQVSIMLSQLTGLNASIFFDKTAWTGYLEKKLQSLRRQLPPSEKKFVWRKRKSTRPDDVADVPAKSTSAGDTAETTNVDGCAMGTEDCEICMGASQACIQEEVRKMNLLCSSRKEDIMETAKKTFCFRRSRVKRKRASFTELVKEIEKYKTVPDIIFHDFKKIYGKESSDALLKTFPVTVSQLLRYCGEPTQVLYLSSQYERSVDEEPSSMTRVMCALRAMLHLMPAGGRDRLSASEAINKVIQVISPSTPMEEVLSKHPHPRIIAQGDAPSYKFHIVCESIICSGMESILETLDLLFKFYWVFELTYPPGLGPFFKYLQFNVYNILYGKEKAPNRVREIYQILKRYEEQD